MAAYSLFDWIIPRRLAYFARAVKLFQLYSNISGFVYRLNVYGVYEKLTESDAIWVPSGSLAQTHFAHKHLTHPTVVFTSPLSDFGDSGR